MFGLTQICNFRPKSSDQYRQLVDKSDFFRCYSMTQCSRSRTTVTFRNTPRLSLRLPRAHVAPERLKADRTLLLASIRRQATDNKGPTPPQSSIDQWAVRTTEKRLCHPNLPPQVPPFRLQPKVSLTSINSTVVHEASDITSETWGD